MPLSSQTDVLADMRAMFAKVADLPPAPRGIRLSLKVPYGRTFRQWDARGRLWLWCNRAEFYDAIGPRVEHATLPTALAGQAFLRHGVDIFHEDDR